MSKHDEGYSSSSFWQLIIAIPGTILGFTLLISLLAHFFGKPEAPAEATPEPAAIEAKVEEAIKPVAEVEVAAASSGAGVERSGEEVTKAVCAMCHAAGLMAAPMIGNKEQWAPRIALGYETLVKHAIEGIRNMPARGGNPDLTDGEVANAVAHMANASGASFEAPKPAASEAAPESDAAPETPAS
ncbi:MAG: c-type cytochrome [Pseudomonadota bacterium]